MAVKLSAKAQEALKASKAPKVPASETSMVAALWALPARRGQTLMMVHRTNGRTFQVLEYNAATATILLKRMDGKGEFKSKVTRDTEQYQPFWR